MPNGIGDPWSVDELARRVHDTDSFRVAIRGHALLEALLDVGLREALVGGAAPDIMKLNFARRATLAVSLGIIDVNLRSLLHEISRIRNSFAHGTLDELTPERTRELVAPLRAVFPAPADGDLLPDVLAGLDLLGPLEQLKSAMMGAHVAIGVAIRQAREEREERDRAVTERRLGFARNRLAALLALREQEGAEGDEPPGGDE